jgi:uncharacterized phage protein (TIGR01671 family)
MREIKFKAWDKDSKKFLNGDFSLGIETGQFRSKYGDVYKNVDVLQFTGLKDKNGKDIYEGDILNIHVFTQELGEGLGVYEGEKEFKGVIKFETLGLYLENKEDEDSNFYLVYSPGNIHEESFEILGNIHENPDLLT